MSSVYYKLLNTCNQDRIHNSRAKHATMRKCRTCGKLFVPVVREHCCPSCSQMVGKARIRAK